MPLLSRLLLDFSGENIPEITKRPNLETSRVIDEDDVFRSRVIGNVITDHNNPFSALELWDALCLGIENVQPEVETNEEEGNSVDKLLNIIKSRIGGDERRIGNILVTLFHEKLHLFVNSTLDEGLDFDIITELSEKKRTIVAEFRSILKKIDFIDRDEYKSHLVLGGKSINRRAKLLEANPDGTDLSSRAILTALEASFKRFQGFKIEKKSIDNFQYDPERQIRSALPNNAVKLDMQLSKKYSNQITLNGWVIPAPPQRIIDRAGLVPLKALPEWARIVFGNIECFNELQSRVFESAFKSSENLLVCAPTGAGKTNVALLCVIQALNRFMRETGVPPDPATFKIVYIAPMKALVSEVHAKFTERLRLIGLQVREVTGDIQPTKADLERTHVIITVPEKWDIITRNATVSGGGEDATSLASSAGLIILDEIHLLADERGPVLESVVARARRLAIASQKPIRLVGLSATLPNPDDVARFLDAPQVVALGAEARPVPLRQSLIGVSAGSFKEKEQKRGEDNKKEKKEGEQIRILSKVDKYNFVAYECIKRLIADNKQVMVFVHSRKDTVATAEALLQFLEEEEDMELKTAMRNAIERRGDATNSQRSDWSFQLKKSNNADVKRLYERGVGIHHAGMLRSDRKLTENVFLDGGIRILFSTATLAWGVNLPAHAVVIKGTEVYNPEMQAWTNISILDVVQIFGRAGRPQFDSLGNAFLITSNESQDSALLHYIRQIGMKTSIASNMGMQLEDFLNAEVATGAVTSLNEALQWVALTYWGNLQKTVNELSDYVFNTMESLHEKRMINLTDTYCTPTDLGRIAAKHYVSVDTIELWQERLAAISFNDDQLSGFQILQLFASATEFKHAKIKDDEEHELNLIKDRVIKNFTPIKFPLTTGQDKICLLLLVYISKIKLQNFSLVSDLSMVTDSAARLLRALFETCLVQNFSLRAKADVNPSVAYKVLEWCKMVEWRQWGPLNGCTLPFIHPLRHFIQPPPSHQTKLMNDALSANKIGGGAGLLKLETLEKLESRKKIDNSSSIDTLFYMSETEVADSLKVNRGEGARILNFVYRLPFIEVSAVVRPLVETAAKLDIKFYPDWTWDERWHGVSERFHLWITNLSETVFFHQTEIVITKENIILASKKDDPVPMTFSVVIPLQDLTDGTEFDGNEDRNQQILISLVSDRWMDCYFSDNVSVASLIRPSKSRHTDLLPLAPLPISAFCDDDIEFMYRSKGMNFLNPVQTQVFHSVFHSDVNILIGAPTGSGKTLMAEMGMLRLFTAHPGKKVVYVAPLKALARERIHDWAKNLGPILNKKVVEMSGDITPDLALIRSADIIITTPEKWDGVSRLWKQRQYVLEVGLLIFDEIHLLGQDRGAIIEVIVSRANSICKLVGGAGMHTRLMGLSTALSNAQDVADWMQVPPQGLFNFRPAVRPVPLRTMIKAFPEKHFCPRMATMNRPAFFAIEQHSPNKPVLIFVASRRQTRITAADLAVLAVNHKPSGNFKLRDSTTEEERLIEEVEDKNFKMALQMGIGVHHAGLSDKDRDLAVKLFADGLTQVLVCTATLAWGVNLPAHLVIIKGTDVFDGDLGRYVDMPLTDVLQMLGRAGRPQFDDQAVGCVYVHSPKKDFYQKFLYEPFPVESALLNHLPDHLNAEITGGVIRSMREAIDWLSQTYFFRRLSANPSFYCPQIFNKENEDEVDPIQNVAVNPFWDNVDVQEAKQRIEQKSWDEKKQQEKLRLVKFLETVVSDAIQTLVTSNCIRTRSRHLEATGDTQLEPTACGRLSSLYYLKHETIRLINDTLCKSNNFSLKDENKKNNNNQQYNKYKNQIKKKDRKRFGLGILDMLRLLCAVPEFSSVPVRHNEDEMLQEMSLIVPFVDPRLEPSMESTIPWGKPSTKCFYMLQAHMFGLPLPIVDFAIDMKKVLDSSLRILQAIGDLALALNSQESIISSVRLLQLLSQGTHPARNPLYSLPNCQLNDEQVESLTTANLSLAHLVTPQDEHSSKIDNLSRICEKHLGWKSTDWLEQNAFIDAVLSLPDASVSCELRQVGQNKLSLEEREILLAKGDIHSAGAHLHNGVYYVPSNCELELMVWVTCHNGAKEFASTPLFPKSRRAGWWVIVGDDEIDEAVGMKKISLTSNGDSICKVAFAAPEESNQGPFELKVRVMSDCYVGLDLVTSISVKTI